MHLTPTETVGLNIRAEMARKGIVQTELAPLLGMKQTAMSARLRGITPIDVNELAAIARHLEVPVASLLTGIEVPA